MFQNSERRTTWIVLFLLVITAALSLGSSYYAHSQSNSVDYWSWLDGAAQNFGTEMLGAIATFFVFEMILGSQKAKREKAERIEELQKRLVREAGSQSNETAKAAVEHLRAEGWLTLEDGIGLLKQSKLVNANMQGANLRRANLQQVDLRRAYLQKADLWEAYLWKADLWEAYLQEADLGYANLQEANLGYTNLQGTHLEETNLQGAYLEKANLYGAHLDAAHLQAANLIGSNLHETFLKDVKLQAANLMYVHLRGAKDIEKAIFNEKTVLPDAVVIRDENGNHLKDEDGSAIYDKYWTPQTDMRRYTDPNHPNFWEPDYLKPDYEGSKPWWVEKQAED